MRALFKKARAFEINGKNVARWVIFLCAQRSNALPSSDAMARLEAMTEVPDSLVEAALVARTGDEAGLLARSFVGQRRGYANTHDEPSAETMTEKGLVHYNALDDGEMPTCQRFRVGED
jgi:hypothetical protein